MLTVRRGEERDYNRIRSFIVRSEAQYQEGCLFILVENEKKEIVGVVGIQLFDQTGLLRSFVFSADFPTEKLPIFLERILLVAQEQKCETLYLVTNKLPSVPFFKVFGFSMIEEDIKIEGEKLSTALLQIKEKDDAMIMWKTL